MRFLANENFPSDAVFALQARGHDVVWVQEALAYNMLVVAWHRIRNSSGKDSLRSVC